MVLESGQVAILVAVIVNIIMVAFSYGSLSQKVHSLEKIGDERSDAIEKLSDRVQDLSERIKALEINTLGWNR